MAKYEVICIECGDLYTTNITGDIASREWKISNWLGKCDECKSIKFAKKQNTLIEFNKEMGLPVMMGSVKQQKWASSIRMDRYYEMLGYVGDIESDERYIQHIPTCIEAISAMMSITDPSYWISEFNKKMTLIDFCNICEYMVEFVNMRDVKYDDF